MPCHVSRSWMCHNLQAQLFGHFNVPEAGVTGWVRWGELPPKYYTAVEVMYTTVWCLHVHHASGRSTRFFPSKCLTVPVYQAVKMQTRSAAALSPTQSSSLNQIPEPPPSMLEAHTVLHTETYICGMTEAIKSADNFQQICVCCYCCCLYNWILTNHKYKKQCPK